MRIFLAALLFFSTMMGSAMSATYTNFGQFYANAAGSADTDSRIEWPDNTGTNYKPVLRYGYDIWNYGDTETPPSGQVWKTSVSLFDAPYNIPTDAKGVRVHFKVKVAGLTTDTQVQHSAFQVRIRPTGSGQNPNEIIPSTAEKHGGLNNVTPYDINHVETDVALGTDGKLDLSIYPTTTGDMYLELVVYVAGYWK